jgi:hypothetical protein
VLRLVKNFTYNISYVNIYNPYALLWRSNGIITTIMLFLRKTHLFIFFVVVVVVVVVVNYVSFLPYLAKYVTSSSNRRSYEGLRNRMKLPCFEVSRQDTGTLLQMYLSFLISSSCLWKQICEQMRAGRYHSTDTPHCKITFWYYF